jgi:alpha-glucosidase (family GH31 glycosyl hydrolase)
MFNVYPDIVGGTALATQKYADVPIEKLKTYFMRYAQYAAIYPCMSFGYGPWNFNDPLVDQVCLESANLHARLHPYIYSSAIDAWKTGFPHTMCPLPLLWPDEAEVYELENDKRRGYQWMLGDSLLATPLYGNDFATSTTRDVFIPPGKWMDYQTGELYQGPQILKAFDLPLGKPPLFVGGKGILAVQNDLSGPICAQVYPIAPDDTTWTYNWPDGESTSTIHIDSISNTQTSIEVIDTNLHHAVEYKLKSTGAIEFEIDMEHTYIVRQKR